MADLGSVKIQGFSPCIYSQTFDKTPQNFLRWLRNSDADSSVPLSAQRGGAPMVGSVNLGHLVSAALRWFVVANNQQVRHFGLSADSTKAPPVSETRTPKAAVCCRCFA